MFGQKPGEDSFLSPPRIRNLFLENDVPRIWKGDNLKDQNLENMVDAVKYPSLAPSIFPASSKKYEVVHYRDGRRRPSGWPILGVFSIYFLNSSNFLQ